MVMRVWIAFVALVALTLTLLAHPPDGLVLYAKTPYGYSPVLSTYRGTYVDLWAYSDRPTHAYLVTQGPWGTRYEYLGVIGPGGVALTRRFNSTGTYYLYLWDSYGRYSQPLCVHVYSPPFIVDVWPSKTEYRYGEPVKVLVNTSVPVMVRVFLTYPDGRTQVLKDEVYVEPGRPTVVLSGRAMVIGWRRIMVVARSLLTGFAITNSTTYYVKH